MKRITISFLIVFLLLSWLGIAFAQHPNTGSSAPPISIKEWLTGEIKGPNPLRGKTVILEFWATWCAPCVAAIPHLNKLADEFAAKDVVFVSISAEERDIVVKFIARKEMKSSVVLDNVVDGLAVTNKTYGVTGIPRTFLIDKTGILRWHGHPNNLTAGLLDQYFKSGKVPASEQKRDDAHTTSSISKDALYTLLISRSQSASIDPKLHGLGVLITRNQADTSEVSYRGGSVVDFISKLLGQPTARIEVDGELPMESFDLTLRVTVPTKDSVLEARAVQVLGDVFQMKMNYETKARKVWALILAFPDRLKPSAVTKGSSTSLTDSTWIGAGVSIPVFARGLESQLKQHFIDETNADGKFDFDVRTSDLNELRTSLQEQYGIVLREAERPIQIMRLTFPMRQQE